ncbi:MAG: ferrochelatase [Acidobacteriota bacterium]|nr:ferrochelatase [Blastocatellia bacterium]MDW8413278.1 ferrochelatase [Acidobacteriota bacterium]
MSRDIGVVLFNLGGPERLDDVRPFLYNFFCQPEILRVRSERLRKLLAWLISTMRYKKSMGYYALIGGGSPLRRITEAQAHALEVELERRKIRARIYVAMRCWRPFTEEVIEEIERDQIKHLICLPLYPQFSFSTTYSSIKHMVKLMEERGGMRQVRRHYITSWHSHPGYIDALVKSIETALADLPDRGPKATHIIFSAHSIPESYVSDGDPYYEHTKATVAETVKRLRPGSLTHLSFQSKVGPVKWLGPMTEQVIWQLGRRGVKQLVLVPVSFVSDHIETLYELDILYRQVAKDAGIEHFRRAAAFNCDPVFISALADLVEDKLVRIGYFKHVKPLAKI